MRSLDSEPLGSILMCPRLYPNEQPAAQDFSHAPEFRAYVSVTVDGISWSNPLPIYFVRQVGLHKSDGFMDDWMMLRSNMK